MPEHVRTVNSCKENFPLEILITTIAITFAIVLLGILKTDFNYLPKSELYDNDTNHGIAKYPIPFMCSVQALMDMKYEHVCGCSIIETRYVLTAAHCINRYKLNELSILFGTNVLDVDDNGMRYNISALKIHPNFKPFGGYDVALIQVGKSFNFDGYRVNKIPLTNRTKFEDKIDVMLIGWGASSKIVMKNLEIVAFRLVSPIYCDVRVKIILTDNEICGFSYKKRGACKGDSGGPILDTAMQELVGMVSYARQACQPRDFYVFSSVQPYKNWINEQMNTLD